MYPGSVGVPLGTRFLKSNDSVTLPLVTSVAAASVTTQLNAAVITSFVPDAENVVDAEVGDVAVTPEPEASVHA
jgi:hypothetical protein